MAAVETDAIRVVRAARAGEVGGGTGEAAQRHVLKVSSRTVQVNGVEVPATDDREYMTEVLPNGVRVVVMADPGAEKVRVLRRSARFAGCWRGGAPGCGFGGMGWF